MLSAEESPSPMPTFAAAEAAGRIGERLRQADRYFQRQRGLSFCLRSVKFVAGFLVLMFLLDVVFHLQPATRIGLVLMYLAGAGLGLAAALYIANIRRNSQEATARRLEELNPALGSSLINTLQLQTRFALAGYEPLSHSLARQAIGNYAERLRHVDLRADLKSPRISRDARQALGALLAVLMLLAVFLPITRLEMLRFLDPYGDHPPYSFTKLVITEPAADGTKVIYGQNLVVSANWSGHEPRELFLTFSPSDHPENKIRLPMFNKGKLGFLQRIENIKTDIQLHVHTANHRSSSKKRLVRVVLTPQLEAAEVEITPPAYTCLKPQTRPYRFSNIKALTGSKLRFSLKSNRPLSWGAVRGYGEEERERNFILEKSGENEVAGGWTVTESVRLRFSMTDADGISSQEILGGSITATHDLPPEIGIPFPENDAFVTEDFKLEAEIVVADDYGIKNVRIHRALNQEYSAPKVIHYEQNQRQVKEVVIFDIKNLGVEPGDVISFYAEAIDTCPQPHLAASRVVNLIVVSVEEYNNFLREQMDIEDIQGKYEQLMNELQGLIDEQARLSREIKKRRELLQKLQGSQAKERTEMELADLLGRQAELNQKLNKLALRLEKFVRPQPLYDLEQELQEVLARLAREIRQSVAKNEAALQALNKGLEAAALPPRRSGLEALEALQAAAENQLARLRGPQLAMREEVLGTLQDLSKMNRLIRHFNYFKHLYKIQTAVATQTRTFNILRNLSRADKLALKQHAATEQFLRRELERLVKELRRDGKAAAAIFPKAAKSAQDLADQIEQARLPFIAGRAAHTMLISAGPASYRLAERLRQEMFRLFKKSCMSSGQMAEMDAYLRLLLGMNPGNTFNQMSRSRKFGAGRGQAGARGVGAAGRYGYAMSASPNMSVLGNESLLSQSQASRRRGRPGRGEGQGRGQGEKELRFDKEHVVTEIRDRRHRSAAVSSPATLAEYRDIVDEYFKTITK